MTPDPALTDTLAKMAATLDRIEARGGGTPASREMRAAITALQETHTTRSETP